MYTGSGRSIFSIKARQLSDRPVKLMPSLLQEADCEAGTSSNSTVTGAFKANFVDSD